MALTIGSLASIDAGSSMVSGQAQANSMGLGQDSGNALALTNLMQKDDDNSLVGNLMKTGLNNQSQSSSALGKSSSRLRGQGLKNDLMNIGGAMTANAIGSGMSSGMKGSLLDTVG